MITYHQFVLLFSILFICIGITGCNLYFPPKSIEDLIPAVTSLPTPPPAPTPLPTPSLPPDGNMIWNGDFESGMNRWAYWVNTGEGTVADISVGSGVLNVIITESGNYDWYIQVQQKYLDIVINKEYTLTFNAWSTEGYRSIRVELGEDGIDNNEDGNNYTSYDSEIVSITMDDTYTYSVVFSMEEATDLNARLVFNLGQGSDPPDPSYNYDVFIDNVSLKEN